MSAIVAGSIVGGANLVGSYLQADAAGDAADAQAESGAAAIRERRLGRKAAIKALRPNLNQGRVANKLLIDALRGDNAGLDQMMDVDGLLELALDDVNRSYAGSGKYYSGQRMEALRDSSAGIRSSLRNEAFNRLLAVGNRETQGRMALANIHGNVSGNIADTRERIGNSVAAGRIGQANAWSNGLNNTANTAANLFALNNLYGG